ncbi:unnamed protein product [Prorocentrum cordatum]|uniref:Uncharacterized protein n=1 Tax=Prorocentrum cordatum TaxID=2364126 RepID=A0ABN9RGV5_9DINO|nr:unnamed protein product [Polarella glacialis]
MVPIMAGDCSPSSASRGPRRASGRKNGPGEWVETSGGRRQEQITTSGVWVGHPAATERARAESAQSQTNVTLLRKWTSLSQRFLTKTAAKKFQRDKSSATKMLHPPKWNPSRAGSEDRAASPMHPRRRRCNRDVGVEKHRRSTKQRGIMHLHSRPRRQQSDAASASAAVARESHGIIAGRELGDSTAEAPAHGLHRTGPLWKSCRRNGNP